MEYGMIEILYWSYTEFELVACFVCLLYCRRPQSYTVMVKLNIWLCALARKIWRIWIQFNMNHNFTWAFATAVKVRVA